MPFLMTDSAAPIAPEALPALKLTEFCGEPARGCIYSYLKCYLHQGDFFYHITVFDETPPPTQYAAIVLSADIGASPWLSLRVGFHTPACLEMHLGSDKDSLERIKPLVCEDAVRFSGGDEQGLYWGAQGVIPACVFREAFGTELHAGSVLMGNVFLYDTTERAFGSAFPVPCAVSVPANEGMQPFVIVPY